MRIKPGVVMPQRIEIYPALWAAEEIWTSHGRLEGVTVTSGREGRHSWGSKHFSDDALDFRVRYWDHHEARQVAAELQSAIGEDYAVVLEWDKIHIHVEYQPKFSKVKK